MKKKKVYVRNAQGKIVCIVYSYTLNEGPQSGQKYVGVTPNEKVRRQCWNKPGGDYAGKKLKDARAIYNPKTAWIYTVHETAEFDTEEEADKWMDQKEEYYIAKFDSRNNGFNSSKGGTGNRGGLSAQHIANIIKNHSHYSPTAEERENLSKKLKGRKRSPEECAKISAGLKGKSKSEVARQSMSVCRKGKKPVALIAANAAARLKKGCGLTKGIKQSAQALANMKEAQQKRGRKVKAISMSEEVIVFNTMLDAAKYFNIGVGSIHHALKTGNFIERIGYKFEEITEEEYQRLLPFNPES